MKNKSMLSAKQESKRISKAVASVTALRKRVAEAEHYVERVDVFCDLCKTRISMPHCYERNGKVVAYLCTRCHNSVSPKRRVTKILFTPM